MKVEISMLNLKPSVLDEIKRISDSVTPAEAIAVAAATLYGREHVPEGYDEHLTDGMGKMISMGWLWHCQLTEERESVGPVPDWSTFAAKTETDSPPPTEANHSPAARVTRSDRIEIILREHGPATAKEIASREKGLSARTVTSVISNNPSRFVEVSRRGSESVYGLADIPVSDVDPDQRTREQIFDYLAKHKKPMTARLIGMAADVTTDKARELLNHEWFRVVKPGRHPKYAIAETKP